MIYTGKEIDSELAKDLASQKEPVDFNKYYVPPHEKKSREVTEADLPKVIEDSHILYNLCYTKTGIYPGAFAVAHPQIDDKDPLRFFVTHDQKIIINPVIVRHTKHTVDSVEGCLTFPYLKPITVKRYNKCEVECYGLTKDGKMGERITLSLSGREAKIFQHEIDHFESVYVYDEMVKQIAQKEYESTNQDANNQARKEDLSPGGDGKEFPGNKEVSQD